MATVFFALLPVVWLGVLGPVPLMGELTQTLGPTFAPLSWIVAAANLTYLIGIGLPSIAVWLLRRDAPAMPRLYRAPRGTIVLGVVAAGVWGVSTILGFEQFGMPTVLAGIAMVFSGSAFYAMRRWSDLRQGSRMQLFRSLHLKLTGAMMLVLTLDGVGYLMAFSSISEQQGARIAGLEDIFVAVALLTITVGLVLPGMIAQAVGEVAHAADLITRGTLTDFLHALRALEAGNLDEAHARVDISPVVVHARDEIGTMAVSFNMMQEQVAQAAGALDGAREGLRHARQELTTSNTQLAIMVTTDPLTGLPNRMKLLTGIAEALQMAEQAGNGMALLMLDLDRFKEVNDTFGHQLGDQLLQQVGARLRQAVGSAVTVARLGGDEFAVLLSPADEAGARQLGCVLGTAIEEAFQIEGYLLQVEAGIGIALYPAHGVDPITLFRHADVAMYIAKRGHERCAG